MKNVTDETFQSLVRESTDPTVVYFTGSWCQPCKNFAPLVEEMAEKHKGDVLFYKADIDDCEKISHVLNIRMLPSLVLFEGGMLQHVKSGTMNKTEFRLWLQENI